MNYNLKLAAASLILIFTSVSQASTALTTKDDFTSDFKIGKSYPVILEGSKSDLLDRTGQFYCGAIAFTADSTDTQLFYTFKAWAPEKGKCNFQSSNPVSELIVTHQCVADKYTKNRFFTTQEIEDTLPGNRAIEIASTDDHFYVLSRCHGTVLKPSYVNLYSAPSIFRDPSMNILVLDMKNESRSFGVLEKNKKKVDVLTIRLNNAFNYVLVKDETIN